MDAVETIYRRRSVREYSSRTVSHGELSRLMEAAIQAPSAVNRQPWFFTVIENRELLDRISSNAKTYLKDRMPAETQPAQLEAVLNDPNFHIFYHAPALILISAVSDDEWAVEDCSLAGQNLMLAACASGLGSCWIGFAKSWLRTAEGKNAIELPPAALPVAPIIVGYPVRDASPVLRNPVQAHWI